MGVGVSELGSFYENREKYRDLRSPRPGTIVPEALDAAAHEICRESMPVQMSTIAPVQPNPRRRVAHVFTSDEPWAWQFYNCGPCQALVEDTVLSPGEIAVFSGRGPFTLLSDSDTVVIIIPVAIS